MSAIAPLPPLQAAGAMIVHALHAAVVAKQQC